MDKVWDFFWSDNREEVVVGVESTCILVEDGRMSAPRTAGDIEAIALADISRTKNELKMK